MYEGPNYSVPTNTCPSFFITVILMGMMSYIVVGLTCISLMINEQVIQLNIYKETTEGALSKAQVTNDRQGDSSEDSETALPCGTKDLSEQFAKRLSLGFTCTRPCL